MTSPALDGLDRETSWSGVDVFVTGLGRSGFAAADTLVHMGATVTAVDERDNEELRDKAELLRILGADVHIGRDAVTVLPDRLDVIVTSPGWHPGSRVFAEAEVPVWSEVELAWRLRGSEHWLVVTGTNGKTSTVQMLDAILTEDGVRSAAVGNVGRPVVEAVMDPEPYDVLAIELSSFQLHWTSTMAADSAAILNVAPDHLDWHGSIEEYTRTKARVYAGCKTACVYNTQDPVTEELVRAAEVAEGCRAIGFGLDVPVPGTLGIVDDVLADRAFVAERQTSAAQLASLHDLSSSAPHHVSNALAAAALARSYGVHPHSVTAGLRNFVADAHRVSYVASASGITWVDDSKATNPHAAAASLNAFDSIVWIAGGLAKGAHFDDLVAGAAGHLKAAVLIGQDRGDIEGAFQRHAPHVHRVSVATSQNDPMDDAVAAAFELAESGDTVLLAPGCASMDQFADYAARGQAFAASVRHVIGR